MDHGNYPKGRIRIQSPRDAAVRRDIVPHGLSSRCLIGAVEDALPLSAATGWGVGSRFCAFCNFFNPGKAAVASEKAASPQVGVWPHPLNLQYSSEVLLLVGWLFPVKVSVEAAAETGNLRCGSQLQAEGGPRAKSKPGLAGRTSAPWLQGQEAAFRDAGGSALLACQPGRRPGGALKPEPWLHSGREKGFEKIKTKLKKSNELRESKGT